MTSWFRISETVPSTQRGYRTDQLHTRESNPSTVQLRPPQSPQLEVFVQVHSGFERANPDELFVLDENQDRCPDESLLDHSQTTRHPVWRDPEASELPEFLTGPSKSDERYPPD